MGLFSGKSFIEKENERLRKLLEEPMLELVLEHLPHLQSTLKEQEDSWEIIAIKLNSYQFSQSLEDSEGEVLELPTLNGPLVKEMFDTVFKKFCDKVYYHNRDLGINRLGSVHADAKAQSALYFTLSFPVMESYSAKTDQICCELYYLKTWAVQVKAQLAKDRLTEKLKNAPPEAPPEHELNEKFEQFVVAENVKEERKKGDKWKIGRLLQELEKKNKRIEQLDKENKRLMELNQSLLERY